MKDRTAGIQTRRDVIAGMGAAVATLVVPEKARTSPSLLALRTVSGRVLDVTSDRDSVGQRPGLPGIMVSNGRDVAVSDEQGRWSLPARKGNRVFVIKPAHWNYALHAGIPTFSEFCDCESQRPSLERTIDFLLCRNPEPASFRVLLVADTQAANAKELEYVRQDIQFLSAHGAAFALHHGDAMGDELSLLGPHRTILAATGLTWHHCPGNHDLDLAARESATAFEPWIETIGPTNYAFQYANATFILLNNVDYLGHGRQGEDGRGYRGRIGPEQLAFVAAILERVPKDQLIVVSMHIPLVSFETPGSPADTTDDHDRLLALLSGHPNTVSFAGHSHTTEHHYLGRDDGFDGDNPHHHHVLTAFCGSWWSGPADESGIPISDSRDGSPRGFHVLNIDGNRYTTEFVPLRGQQNHARISVKPGPYERPAVSNVTQEIHLVEDGAQQLLVDVFDGGPRTRVYFQVEGTEQSTELIRTRAIDPYIAESYSTYRDMLKPWVAAAPSSHMWTGEIRVPPSSQPRPGLLRVVGEYGQERSTTFLI